MDHQPTNQPVTRDTDGPYSQHRTRRHSGGWVGGAILIGLGLLLLLQNLGNFQVDNWWAFFILIPAVGAFSNAYNAYQEAGGQLNGKARSSLFGGAILTFITGMFLFNLDWFILGPVLLIVGGGAILINNMLPE
jgi:hypothetical protein